MDRYYKYSKYLKDIYKEKVYKIPINLPITCPNRDGICGKGGCSFCGDVATGFESQAADMDVKTQMLKNIEIISKKNTKPINLSHTFKISLIPICP